MARIELLETNTVNHEEDYDTFPSIQPWATAMGEDRS